MYLNKIRDRQIRQPVSEADLYKRMRLAIERIEAVYDPNLTYAGTLQTRSNSLNNMSVNTMSDIETWESGWLSLIEAAKQIGGMNV